MAFLELTEFFSGEKILINTDKIVKINKNYTFDQETEHATDIICNVTSITVKESYEEIKDTIDYYLIRFRE